MATLVRLTSARRCLCNIESIQNVSLPRTIIRVISTGVRLNAISHEKSKKEKGWRGKVGETGRNGRMKWRMDEKEEE